MPFLFIETNTEEGEYKKEKKSIQVNIWISPMVAKVQYTIQHESRKLQISKGKVLATCMFGHSIHGSKENKC